MEYIINNTTTQIGQVFLGGKWVSIPPKGQIISMQYPTNRSNGIQVTPRTMKVRTHFLSEPTRISANRGRIRHKKR